MYGTDPRATATVAGNMLKATGQAIDKSAVSLINRLDTGPDYVELFENVGGTVEWKNGRPAEDGQALPQK